ncbi:MAG: hypothetical protein FWD64_12735, partial [Acidobacteriaceae bacterium]|nr:hypothetical protein [Acidobacteriaceae bacterium]
LEIDGEMKLKYIDDSFRDTLALMEPFGNGNPAPVIEFCNVVVSNVDRHKATLIDMRDGKHGPQIEAYIRDQDVVAGTYGDFAVEMHSRTNVLRRVA